MSEIAFEWLLIGVLGIVTLFTRVAGVGLAKWVPRAYFWQRVMHHVPATLLVAICIPAFAGGDELVAAAAAITLVCAVFSLPLVVCMGIGMGAVALMRMFIH